jgi:hypothetical protein
MVSRHGTVPHVSYYLSCQNHCCHQVPLRLAHAPLRLSLDPLHRGNRCATWGVNCGSSFCPLPCSYGDRGHTRSHDPTPTISHWPINRHYGALVSSSATCIFFLQALPLELPRPQCLQIQSAPPQLCRRAAAPLHRNEAFLHCSSTLRRAPRPE